MLRLRPASLNRSHLALSHLTFTTDGEVVDTRRRRLKSALWSSEMFHFSFFFQWARCRGSGEGACLLIWMPEQENMCLESGKIHLSVIFDHAQHPIQPSSSQSGREAVWGKLNKKNKKKTTNINEVLHWGITMCALPDSICTSLMACAIMWASINIKAGSVTAKGFTSITAVPPLHVSISTQGKKYMWNTASVPGY